MLVDARSDARTLVVQSFSPKDVCSVGACAGTCEEDPTSASPEGLACWKYAKSTVCTHACTQPITQSTTLQIRDSQNGLPWILGANCFSFWSFLLRGGRLASRCCWTSERQAARGLSVRSVVELHLHNLESWWWHVFLLYMTYYLFIDWTWYCKDTHDFSIQ